MNNQFRKKFRKLCQKIKFQAKEHLIENSKNVKNMKKKMN